MNNKEIQRKRVMSYFIDATEELIYEVGIEDITLRKVANRAGYNSATLYNYFENLDHLIFYASMKHLKDYGRALNTYLIGANNSMDRFFKVWECFCDYSFDKPDIYSAIFFPNLDKDLNYYMEEYYNFFPEDLTDINNNIANMLSKSDIIERGMITINDCVDEGFIKKEDAKPLNNMTLLLYESMLRKVKKGKISYDDGRNETMEYIKYIIERFIIKEYDYYF